MPPTKGGTRPPKGGKGSGKGKGTRAPIPGSVSVAAAGAGSGKGKASIHSGGTKTRGSVSKRAASDSKAGKKSGKDGKKKSKPRGRKPAWKKWAGYIHRLQRTDKELTMSRRAMAIVGAFVEDMFERLTTQASTVARMHRLATVTAKEIQTAARLVLPPAFASHSISEGTRAVTRYNQNKEQGMQE